MPREYQNALGQIVLDYSKAIQESVFEQLRVVRDGHLRIVFNPDLKVNYICNWLPVLVLFVQLDIAENLPPRCYGYFMFFY